jgi:hypothetical protein
MQYSLHRFCPRQSYFMEAIPSSIRAASARIRKSSAFFHNQIAATSTSACECCLVLIRYRFPRAVADRIDELTLGSRTPTLSCPWPSLSGLTRASASNPERVAERHPQTPQVAAVAAPVGRCVATVATRFRSDDCRGGWPLRWRWRCRRTRAPRPHMPVRPRGR